MHRARARILLALGILLVAGCASPGATQEPDARYAAFLADGWSPAGARLLADTQVEVVRASPARIELRETLPFGTTIDLAFELRPDTRAGNADEAPRQLYDLAFEAGEVDGRARFAWSYFVPERALSADTLAALEGRAAPASALALFRVASAQGGSETSGIQVAATAVMDEAANTFQGQLEGYVLEHYGLEGNPVTQAISSAQDVTEAFSTLRPEHLKWIERLRQARACAESPANPLTQKAYDEDPGYKQRTLDEIDVAIAEIKMNTAVRFLGAEAKAGAGLVPNPAAATVMSLIAAPVVAHTDKELSALSEERVAQVERLVQGFCTCGVPTQPPAEAAPVASEGGAPPAAAGGSDAPSAAAADACEEGLHLTYSGTAEGSFTLREPLDGGGERTGSGTYRATYRWRAHMEYVADGYWIGGDEFPVEASASYSQTITERRESFTHTGTVRCEASRTITHLASAHGAPNAAGFEAQFQVLAQEVPTWTCVYEGTDRAPQDVETAFYAAPHAAATGNVATFVQTLRPGVAESISHAGGGAIPKKAPSELHGIYCQLLVSVFVFEGASGSCSWQGTMTTRWV